VSAAVTDWIPSSVADNEVKEPPKLPMGVLERDTIYTGFIFINFCGAKVLLFYGNQFDLFDYNAQPGNHEYQCENIRHKWSTIQIQCNYSPQIILSVSMRLLFAKWNQVSLVTL
jgi:hypothetical protein